MTLVWVPDSKARAWKKEKRRAKKRAASKPNPEPFDPLLYQPGEIFYESERWKRLRKIVLQTYGRRCMKCDIVNVETHVDHIVPRTRAPHLSLTFSNLQVLCRECNYEKSNLHATDYRESAWARRRARAKTLAAMLKATGCKSFAELKDRSATEPELIATANGVIRVALALGDLPAAAMCDDYREAIARLGEGC